MKAIVIVLVLMLAGCGAKFVPVDIGLQPSKAGDNRARLADEMLNRLAIDRGVPFAIDYKKGSYALKGLAMNPDETEVVILLEHTDMSFFALRYAYVYLSFGASPGIRADQNVAQTNVRDGISIEPEGTYRGIYRLSLTDAWLCYGETKQVPVIKDGRFVIEASDRILRRSMYADMKKHYIPTTCQGLQGSKPGETPLRGGVRFYFSSMDELNDFASLLIEIFPRISQSR